MSEIEELRADVAFLLLRSGSAGSCNFTNDRWTGLSSNALVAVAYGDPKQRAMPSDRADYAACVRTFVRLPKHRRTSAVRRALALAKEAYLKNYPEDRFPGPRNAKHAEYMAAWEASQKKYRRWRRS